MFNYNTGSKSLNPYNKSEYKRKKFITDLVAPRSERVAPKVYWYRKGLLEGISFRKEKSIYMRKGKKSYHILPYGCAFDTEFYTKVERNSDGKIKSANAYVYIWQLAIDDVVILSRNLLEFKECILEIIKKFNINSNNRMIMLIANSGCEFQHIRKYVNIFNGFMLDDRTPLTFNIESEGLVCLDALKISNTNLKKISENFCTTKKLVGDIDYTLPRHMCTPLSDKEIQYCINDVVILIEYFNYLKVLYLKNGYEIPLTSTGIVRQAVKELFYNNKKFNKIKKACRLSKDLYDMIRGKCFRGGYTHSNVLHTGEVLHDVTGVDFTSSYPAVMMHCRYPMESPKKWGCSFKDLLSYQQETKCCWVGKFILKNVNNITSHSIESLSHTDEYLSSEYKSLPYLIRKYGITYDNGRILSMDKMTVYLTEQDYEIYKMFYTFDIEKVEDLYYMKSDYLPEYLIKPMMHFYEKKCTLKKQHLDDTPEYTSAKALVNSFYGLTVQKFNDVCTLYDNHLNYEDNEYKEESILSPMWGVWVTAHARHALLSVVRQIDDDVVYCDTDSIYMLNFEKHKHIIDDYNNKIISLNTKYNEYFKDIGCFDIITDKDSGKTVFEKFKTLGAKRYIKTCDGKAHVTIAGLPKKALPEYASDKKIDIYEAFDDYMKIPATFSLKNATKYNDSEHEDDIIDCNNVKFHMKQRSSLGIFSVEFTMTLDSIYKTLISNLSVRA